MLCHSLENHLVRAYVYLRLKHAPEGRQRKNAVFMIKYRIPNHSIPCPTTSSDPRCKKKCKMTNLYFYFLFFCKYLQVVICTYKSVFGGSTYKICKCYLQKIQLCHQSSICDDLPSLIMLMQELSPRGSTVNVVHLLDL